MTMTLADGFKMLKRNDMANPEPKRRMHFWYAQDQALLVDKAKPSATDIGKALGGKPAKAPHCFGRIGLYNGADNKLEMRIAIAGAVPARLVKDLKAEAKEHGLRGIEVVIAGPSGDDEEEEAKAPPADATGPLLLQKLQDLVPDFKKAQSSPIAGAKLVELMQKAKKHIDAKDYAKAQTDIDNLGTLIALALKHDQKAPVAQPGTGAKTPQEEFATEVRRQKNSARATRVGAVLDTVKAEKYFPPGMAAQFAKEGLKPGKEFALFLTALKNFEDKYQFRRELFQKDKRGGAPVDVTPFLHDIDEMTQLTQAYLDHHARDLSAEQQAQKESQRKKQICLVTLKMLQQTRIKAEFEDLGHPKDWDLKKENQAAALYAKVLFEEGNAPAQKLPPGDSGESGAWWVEALDFTDPKLKNRKKKFIFKPSDAEPEVPGFPKGGSAPREVVSKVAVDRIQAATGLDFDFPETALVAIDDAKLADPDKEGSPPASGKQRMGSMQHFNKSGKPFNVLRKADTGLAKRIPKEEVQKTAVMDLITLNLDRHPGNFLVDQTPGGDPKASPKLIPIDHGLTLPSREGLDARRTRLHDNAVNSMPASREKFTPEMLAKIRQIDADEVVRSMQASMQALKELHPDARLDEMVPEANFELTRRSIEFMKKAAAELSVDELFDAYAVNAEDIFDSKPEEQAKAHAKAIREAKDRSAARRELKAIDEDETRRKKLKTTVQGLGWVVDVFSDADFVRWCAMNPARVMNIYNYHIENPEMRAELDAMIEQLGPQTPLAAKIRRQTLRDGHAAATSALQKQGKAKPVEAPPAKLSSGDVLKAMQGLAKELPGTVPGDPVGQQALAPLWIEYQALGGFNALCRLGGDAEIKTLKERLKALKALKASEGPLATIVQLGPVSRQENLERRRATRMAVLEEGIARIVDPAVKGPIDVLYQQAETARDAEKPADYETALAAAEKLLEPALVRIDNLDNQYGDRLVVVLDRINTQAPTSALYRKLIGAYRDANRLLGAQEYAACEQVLKPLEAEAEKAAKAVETTT